MEANDNAEELEEKPDYGSINIDHSSVLPSSIREGPEIKIAHIDITKINKHVCEGDSTVRLLLTGKKGKNQQVHANQETFSRNGTFLNYFFISTVVIQNKSKEPIAILELSGEYEDSKGNWCPCEDVKLAPAATDGTGESHWLSNTSVNLEPLKLATFTVRADVQVHGKSGSNNEQRRRAHQSLPQPCKIRLQLHDTEGKTTSLIVEQVNDPLDLPTKEKVKEKFDCEDLIAFIYADDCDQQERYWVAVYCEDKSKLRISFGYGLSGYETRYLDTWLIKKLCNEAKQTASREIVLTEWNHTWRNMTALFDRKTFVLLGIRVELKTETSKAIETILLPLDKIRERFTIEELEPDENRIESTQTSIS